VGCAMPSSYWVWSQGITDPPRASRSIPYRDVRGRSWISSSLSARVNSAMSTASMAQTWPLIRAAASWPDSWVTYACLARLRLA
jgi:hypothetical protein